MLDRVKDGAMVEARYENPQDIWYTYFKIKHDGKTFLCSSWDGCFDVMVPQPPSNPNDYEDKPFTEEALAKTLLELANNSSILFRYSFR